MEYSNGQHNQSTGHGSNNQSSGNYYPPYQPEPKNNFDTASMILGILSLLSICTFFLPLPLGALGILFAILGKRRKKQLSVSAITGIATSAISVMISTAFIGLTVFFTINMMKPENKHSLDSLFEQTYGMDFDEYMEDFGESMGDFYGMDLEELFNQLR